MKQLDDYTPSVRQAVLKLRAADLDPAVLDDMTSVIVDLVAAKLLEKANEKLREQLVKRDAKWRAHVETLREEITRLRAQRRT